MPMMTLRRIAPLLHRASGKLATQGDLNQLARAIDVRRRQRGTSKLGRRLRRKHELGRDGSF